MSSNEGTPPGTREPLQRETILVQDDRYRLGLLLVVAALGGVGVGFGLASMAYRTRLPVLARVVPFDVGPRATPSLLGGSAHVPPPVRHHHRHAPASCDAAAAGGPWLGVQLQSLNPQIARELGVSSDVDGGAVITWVFRNSPAAAAGLESGDVVVAIDGEPVRDAADLVEAIRARALGESVELTVERDGERSTLSATPADRAANDNRR